MLFLTGRGDHAVAGPGTTTSQGVSLAAACGFYASQPDPEWDAVEFGPFGYYFDAVPPAPDPPAPPAAALRLSTGDAAFCQFIEHDIVAAVERHATLAPPPGEEPRPLPRIMVLGTLANLRTGRLDLDSLYGGAALQGLLAEQCAKRWLRHPERRARLWLGGAGEAGAPAPPDVLRLGRLQDHGVLAGLEVGDLPGDLRAIFLQPQAGAAPAFDRARAILGDGRNAGSAALCALHLALARLHNLTVDLAPDLGGPDDDTSEAAFVFARRLVRWHYQWLILNDLLPRLACRATLAQVIGTGAPLYAVFLDQISGKDRSQMPLPLEVAGAILPWLGDGGGVGATLLRRGQRLNLASAQAAARGLALRGLTLPPDPPGGTDTPLVCHLVREAQAEGAGRRLGTLGSRLLAETLCGLVLHDPESYWNAADGPPGSWHPRRGARPAGRIIDSLAALSRLAQA